MHWDFEIGESGGHCTFIGRPMLLRWLIQPEGDLVKHQSNKRDISYPAMSPDPGGSHRWRDGASRRRGMDPDGGAAVALDNEVSRRCAASSGAMHSRRPMAVPLMASTVAVHPRREEGD